MNPNVPYLISPRDPVTFEVLDPAGKAPSHPGIDLPEDWMRSGTLTVAMAGARSSGKSLYIAVVVKLLRDLLTANRGFLNAADEYTRRTYEENYERPLFEEMGLMPPTPPSANPDAYQNRPLIYDLGFHIRVNPADNQQVRQKVYLVLQDVAGEDLREEGFVERAPKLSFFRNADRIVFLYDPMAVNRIRQLLEGTVSTNEVGRENPAMILQNILRLMSPERTPTIALTLSKFDMLQRLAYVDQVGSGGIQGQTVDWQAAMSNYGASFRRESNPPNEPFDWVDRQAMHYEIRSMLSALGAMEMLNLLETQSPTGQPVPYSCHAVSALGDSPEGDSVSRMGIAPFRVLDPIREMFSLYGLFEGGM